MSYSVDIAELESAFSDAADSPFNGEFYVNGEFIFAVDFANFCNNVVNHFGGKLLEMVKERDGEYFTCKIGELIYDVRNEGSCDYGICFSVFVTSDLRVRHESESDEECDEDDDSDE